MAAGRIDAFLIAAALAHAARKGSFMYTGTKQHEWRCSRCGALLGVEQRGKIHLKYKAVQFVVEGSITTECRRCAEQNQIESNHPPPPANETRA